MEQAIHGSVIAQELRDPLPISRYPTRDPAVAEGVSLAMIQRPLFYRWFVPVAIAVSAVAGIFVATSTVVARLARDTVASRPLILILHGRGQLGRDTAQIRTEWRGALETGISKLTDQPLIGMDDVRLVWYADVLDPASSAGCDSDARSRPQRTNDSGDVLQLLLGVTSTLFTALYESMPDESRSSMRGLIGDVLYLGDRWKRCAVEHRVESALTQAAREGRPVVLVAHSFGSLVGYSYLRADRPHEARLTPVIHRYVTLGSMLGIPELRELLLGRAGALSLPSGVRSWVNVRHARDPFAAPLADSARATHETAVIREVVTSGPAIDPHDIVTYLRDPVAARAIAWAWCDAGGKAHSPACGDIRDTAP
jgi:endonuclease G, mitochondrial